jgi:hypothetical protein
MKYLKSINEVKKSDIVEYIKLCFVDILEDDRFDSDYTIHGSGTIFKIGIAMKTPRSEGNPYIGTWNTNIEDMINNSEIIKELLLDINSSINRFIDEYPIKYNISTNKIGTIYINFYLTKFRGDLNI